MDIINGILAVAGILCLGFIVIPWLFKLIVDIYRAFTRENDRFD